MSTGIPSSEARQTAADFKMSMRPAAPELEGTGRFDFSKTWSGGLTGTSQGVMLSGGDPESGQAGYVALEAFRGTIDGRQGSITFQQFGSMTQTGQVLHYEIVPGSGTDDLVGVGGVVELTVDADGSHHVVLRYRG